jgi:hypothetical protein
MATTKSDPAVWKLSKRASSRAPSVKTGGASFLKLTIIAEFFIAGRRLHRGMQIFC